MLRNAAVEGGGAGTGCFQGFNLALHFCAHGKALTVSRTLPPPAHTNDLRTINNEEKIFVRIRRRGGWKEANIRSRAGAIG